VAVLAASPESRAAAERLAAQIDLPTIPRESPRARDLRALVREARDGYPETLVVVLDAERATVSALRPRDGTIGSRALSPAAAREPYALALAAAELLELVRAAPLAEAASLPPPTPRSPTSSVSVTLGVQQSTGSSGPLAQLAPSVGLGIIGPAAPGAAFFGVGLVATGLGPERRQPLALSLPGGEVEGELAYTREELSLRPRVGLRDGPVALSAFFDLGGLRATARAREAGGREVLEDRRITAWVGAGGELGYSLGAGFSLDLAAGLAIFPSISRYFPGPRGGADGAPSLEENGAEARARVAIGWAASL